MKCLFPIVLMLLVPSISSAYWHASKLPVAKGSSGSIVLKNY